MCRVQQTAATATVPLSLFLLSIYSSNYTPSLFTMDVLTERTANILLDDHDDDDDDDVDFTDNGEAFESRVGLKDRRLKPSKASKRRRRSSARFLKLDRNVDDDEDEDDANHLPHHNNENLGEVYQNAIRMNAENKINASNSWNLNLIDHMDRFLTTNTNGGVGASGQNQRIQPSMEDTLGPVTGVNFTKASCTLDASVKIYSYRVDDVHLTSYKVLANLNRTDTCKKKSNNNSNNTSEDGEDRREEAREERRAARGNAETLETNLANINISKLDAAFDIDPLFHKMSKTFDEGGAKGLLLANLNVSAVGCNIVFDSTLDNDTAEEQVSSENDDNGDVGMADAATGPLTSVDVSSLTARLESSLPNGQTVHQMPLVPQLVSLRSEFAQLKEEGFVENVKASRRYAAPKADEVEADRSIHVEAIERSRASQADLGRSLMMADDPDDDSFLSGDDGGCGGGGFAPDDFGGADDDDDDIMGGGDAFPVSFIHDGDHRFSSESFQTTFAAARPPSQATVLLDAIAAGHISGSQSNYEYFNKKALETMILQGNGNQWAGAAHWKKMQPKRKPNKKAGATTDDSQESTSTTTTKTTKKKKGGRTNKTKRGGGIVVDISKPALADIKDILKKAPKGKKGSSNPLQMTKAAISKASKNENLLPLDAGIKVENFTSLFLRPNTNVHDISAAAQSSASMPTRQVGFGGVETWGQNDSFGGDDDDGPGFNFGGDFDDDNGPAGDYVVPELEGVRKVEKVRVGYATIAKKVDVRRLKMDLWDELDRTFQERGPTPAWEPKQKTVEGDEEDIDDDATVDEDDDKMNDNDDGKAKDQQQRQDLLSFQDTVREMQTSQSQSDVSLPFYFICILHLANEKGLALESCGLEDFIIHSS